MGDRDWYLGAAGLAVILVPFFAYYRILCVSFSNLHASTLRIQTLSTRTAIFLPVYSVIIWVSLVFPVAYVPLEVPTALAEGYCFYCFFTMVVTNLGGAAETVAVMEESGRRPFCCPCCCPPVPALFFQRVQTALFHCLWTRTAVVLASTVCTFVAHTSQTYANPAFLASLILTVLSLALLVNGFGSLVLFYQVIMEESANLLGTAKIILLKISVGLIVIQGLIEEFLFAFGVIKVEGSSSFSGKERAQRFYCFIVLVEYALLSSAVYYAYTSEIKPNDRHSKVRITSVLMDDPDGALSGGVTSTASDSIRISTVNTGGSGGEAEGGDAPLTGQGGGPLTFGEYVCRVFAFTDVFVGLSAADAERPLILNP